MIFRDVIFESEAVEQRSLPNCSLAHHARIPTATMRIELALQLRFLFDMSLLC